MNTKFPTAQLPENADLLDVLMAYGLSFSEGQAVRHIVDGDLVAAVEMLQRHIQYEAQLKPAPVPADAPKAFVPEPVPVAEPEPEPVAEPEPEAPPAPSKVTSALAQRILSRGGGLTVAQELAMPQLGCRAWVKPSTRPGRGRPTYKKPLAQESRCCRRWPMRHPAQQSLWWCALTAAAPRSTASTSQTFLPTHRVIG